MYIYDEKKNELFASTDGRTEADDSQGATSGRSSDGLPIIDSYVKLKNGQRAMLYRPADPSQQKDIAVICIHAGADYSLLRMCGELAKRGFVALGGQVSRPSGSDDERFRDVNRAVKFLKQFPGVKKVVLMGHSGGATLMSGYQSIAENGVKIFQRDDMLVKCTLEQQMTPADGVMLLDSNFGNGTMTLLSIDPSVKVNGNGLDLDDSLDAYSPKNGFSPDGCIYTEEFKERFFRAQAKRNNALIDLALERLKLIEAGKGNYLDDEPFVITGGSQIKPCNRLINPDVTLLSHTKEAYPLLHPDGSVTTEIVKSLRPVDGKMDPTKITFGLMNTTVRNFLSGHAVRAAENYRITETGMEGVEWDHTFNCTPGNVRYIHAPLLVMGMTGGYEYLAAEVIYQNAASEDKSIAFVEGASHEFETEPGAENYPGQFGDTYQTLCNYVAKWLSAEGRFE